MRWAAVVLYAGAILAASSVSGPSADRLDIPYDKLLHFAEFALFAVLLVVAASPAGETSWRTYLFATFVGVAYGALDEAYQFHVPGRSAEFADVLADAAGVVGGVCFCAVFGRRLCGLRRRTETHSRKESDRVSGSLTDDRKGAS